MFLSRYFPMPKFLELPSFGLDISDESLKFVKLIQTKDGIRVSHYGEKKIPAGIVDSGKIKDPQRMKEILVSLKKEEGIESVRASLSEEQVYLFNSKLEKAGLLDIREGIEFSLEEHIPISAQDTIFDYELLSEGEHDLKLQVVAIQKNVVEDFFTVFEEAGIVVNSFEPEAEAIRRSVIKTGDMETYMVVDFGEKHSSIFVISKGMVVFTSTLDVGGAMLTSMIEKNFKISFEEAEKKKKECGLKRNATNTEVFSVLLNGVSILRDEIVKHFLYWNTHKDEEGNNRPQIKKVILCGGDSNLIGLAEYFSVSIKTTVETANVWINIAETEKYIPEISADQSLIFASALGLALGDFKND